MRLAPKSRLTDILTIVGMLILVFGMAIGILIVPDKEFSEQENRVLQQKPELTLESLVSGKFTSEIADYFADQLPLRDLFVGIKGVCEIGQLKLQNNDVVAASDGYIISRDTMSDYSYIDKNLASIEAFAPAMKELDVPFTVAFAGRRVDALQCKLPSIYPNDNSDSLWEYFNSRMEADSELFDYVNLLEPLRARIEASDESGDDELLYYRTDHHWTVFGAYYGYAEIMRAMGYEPQPLSAFTAELASDEFYGTTWSSAGMKWIKPDSLYFSRYEGDEEFTTTIADTGESFSGFYDRSYLEKKDKYSAYIGGNNARVTITKNDPTEKREKLLLIKDSYAHSVAPYLAYHFDLEILDLRYYRKSVKDFVVENDIDRVLILNYIGSITDQTVFGILQFGLK